MLKFFKSISLSVCLLAPSLLGQVLLSSHAQASCGGAFCNLNTDWDVQDIPSKAGIRLDVRAEFIDLDRLRHGTDLTRPTGQLGEHDELRTINRNLLTTLDWNINPAWGVTFKVPLVDRMHKHIFNDDDGVGGNDPKEEKWNFSGLGDVQAISHYRFYSDKASNAGIRFGVKLPTGSTSKSNGEELAEHTLQPGSGSIDTLLGAYYNHHNDNINWFVQGIWQQSVHQRDDFEPGRKLSIDLGLSYNAMPDLTLMLQGNLQYKAKDKGTKAETADSGGYSIYLSPGLSYRVASGTQIYGFLQKPIYQYVNGAQLTSDWTIAVGINRQF